MQWSLILLFWLADKTPLLLSIAILAGASYFGFVKRAMIASSVSSALKKLTRRR